MPRESHAERAALLVPGAAPIHQPLLAFAEVACLARECPAHRIWWSRPEGDLPSLVPWVCDQVRTALDELGAERPAASTPLVVGKSLGTLGARVAADRGLPAIWFTPILNDPGIVGEYEQATAPRLLVGGTGDPMWDGDVARRLSPFVFEVPGANHGMFIEGRPLREWGRVLGEVGAAVERFLDEMVWPT